MRILSCALEIISYIQDLIDKKIAYESNGSVYFNTQQFTCCGHKYGKLMPEQIGNSDLLSEGEGAISSNDDKKNLSDFVLWKKTKVHTNGMLEPSWESAWGPGIKKFLIFIYLYLFDRN